MKDLHPAFFASLDNILRALAEGEIEEETAAKAMDVLIAAAQSASPVAGANVPNVDDMITSMHGTVNALAAAGAFGEDDPVKKIIDAARSFVRDVETDFVSDGNFVDNPGSLWGGIVPNYTAIKQALGAYDAEG